MKHRIMAWLMAAVLMVSLLSVTAWAEGNETAVTAGGIVLSASQPYALTSKDGTVTTGNAGAENYNIYFDSVNATLYLRDATISTDGHGIFFPDGNFTLQYSGVNTITTTGTGNYAAITQDYCPNYDCKLTIRDDGGASDQLNVTGEVFALNLVNIDVDGCYIVAKGLGSGSADVCINLRGYTGSTIRNSILDITAASNGLTFYTRNGNKTVFTDSTLTMKVSGVGINASNSLVEFSACNFDITANGMAAIMSQYGTIDIENCSGSLYGQTCGVYSICGRSAGIANTNDDPKVSISGGTLTVGGTYGALVYGDLSCTGTNITFTNAPTYGFWIASQNGATYSSDIEITKSTITGETCTAQVIATIHTTQNLNINGSTITGDTLCSGNIPITVKDNFTFDQDFSLTTGSITVDNSAVLTIPAEYELTVTDKGKITNNGTIVFSGDVTDRVSASSITYGGPLTLSAAFTPNITLPSADFSLAGQAVTFYAGDTELGSCGVIWDNTNNQYVATLNLSSVELIPKDTPYKVTAKINSESGTGFYGGNYRIIGESEGTNLTVSRAEQAPPTAGIGYSIDYDSESITADESYELSAESGAVTGSGNINITPGTDVYIRLKETAAYDASAWVTVKIPERPAAPAGITGGTRVIHGVDVTMEYSSDGGKTWIQFTEKTLSNISAGTYLVRYCATSSSFAGQSTSEIIVSEGSSSGGSSATRYPVTVEDTDNGSVRVSPTRAERGDTVTITVDPDDGYELDTLIVTDSRGNELALTDKGGGEYTFTMPGSRVTVEAVFTEIAPEPLPFTDIPEGYWAETAIRYVYENGMMTGTSGATFSPETTITRGQIVTILWRLESSPVVDYLIDFSDVDPAAYYGEAIRWAASEGVAVGYGNGRFGPGDTITREQLAVMLYRYAQYKGYDATQGGMAIREYSDYDQISGYALEAMDWAVNAGLISGTSGSTLSPQGSATRAQAAVILMRFCENIV